MAYVVKRNGRFTGYYRKNGKRLSAGTWDTHDLAQYHALRAQENGSEAPSRANMTLEQFINEWLPNSDLMPITKKGYASVLKNYVLPKIGQKRLTTISNIETVVDAMPRPRPDAWRTCHLHNSVRSPLDNLHCNFEATTCCCSFFSPAISTTFLSTARYCFFSSSDI